MRVGERQLACALAQALGLLARAVGPQRVLRVAGEHELAVAGHRQEVLGQLGGAQRHAAVALLLSEQQRTVGAGDQGGGALARLPLGHPGGGPGGAARPIHAAHRARDPLDRALSHLGRRPLVGVDRHDRELVAAVAGHQVVGAHRLAQGVAHAPQHLVAGQVALALVHALEVVEVHDRQREAVTGAPAAFELAAQAVVHRRVVEAAGERVCARGQHQPGVGARVAAGGRGEVGEGLEQCQVVARDQTGLEVAHRHGAAQLPVPVHRHGQRAAHLRERRQRHLARQCLVVVGEHRLVALDALAHQTLARVDVRADHLGRQAGGGLEAQPLAGVAQEDVGVVGAEDAGRLLADPHEHAVELEALVERARRACQRGLAGGLGGVLGCQLELRKAGLGGIGEGARHLERLGVEVALVGVGQHEHVTHRLAHAHGQQQSGLHAGASTEPAHEPLGLVAAEVQRRLARAQQLRRRRRLGQRHEVVGRVAGRRHRRHLQAALQLGHREQQRAAHAKEAARLGHERVGHRARAAGGHRGAEQARHGMHGLPRPAEAGRLFATGVSTGPAGGALGHTHPSAR